MGSVASPSALREVTLVVAGAGEAESLTQQDLDTAIREGIAAERSSSELAASLAKLHCRPRREVYARILALRNAR